MTTLIIIILFALIAFFLLYIFESNRAKTDSLSTPKVSTSIKSSTKRSNSHFSADGKIDVEYMKSMVTRWANDYANNYRVPSEGVIEHELYMFCGWIAWNYLLNNGYLSDDAFHKFMPFIHEKVNKAKVLSDEEFYAFCHARFEMYKYELNRLRTSDKPYIMETLYGALYKSLFLEEETYYDTSLYNEFGEVCEFMDNFIDFWNKVNKELLDNYKKRR